MKHFFKQLVAVLILLPCVTDGQVITNFAGSGTTLGDGGPATSALVSFPACGSFDAIGNYYFAQTGRIRMVDAAGIIHTVVGTGAIGFSGDGGPATSAKINSSCVATVDPSGNIYLADWLNYRVRKVDKATGIIHTIAGNGTPSVTGDGGPATAATTIPDEGICLDKVGNIYIIDSQGVWIRKIDTAGIITKIAGNGIGANTGDGGMATNASVNVAVGICTDSLGNVFLGCDSMIRKINVSIGIISKIAGRGNGTYTGDGMHADSAGFEDYGLCFDAIGDLYIADYGNFRVRKIDTAGIIHTVAGTGVLGYSGDGGPATAAKIHFPEGVATDACGNLYIADEANSRIRKVTFPTPLLTYPSISLSGIITAPVGTIVTVTATVVDAGSSYVIHWFSNGVEFTTTTVPSVTYTKGASIDTITARVVSTATYGCYDSTTSAGHIVTANTLETGLTAVQNETNIYPNPSNTEITITATNKITSITLSNPLGQLLLTKQGISAHEQLNITHLPPGVYLIKVTDTEGKTTVAKIVKQ